MQSDISRRRFLGAAGARLWNDGGDDISTDEFGIQTAKNLGKRVAEVTLRLK
ncbi:hypothetical protein Q31b_45460 [Novipirellula aureliae]|uniref:Uncharacterized protein n=1 Tax=Novipirellula aureliae TaxID=2527966 RepID=A0A5C6DPE7_9BACT|nr:hypothetical protein [Novipirellula aureliae]TWU37757.1 hypothetical protein Q31b_45460 [Novipirellula aureliae]